MWAIRIDTYLYSLWPTARQRFKGPGMREKSTKGWQQPYPYYCVLYTAKCVVRLGCSTGHVGLSSSGHSETSAATRDPTGSCDRRKAGDSRNVFWWSCSKGLSSDWNYHNNCEKNCMTMFIYLLVWIPLISALLFWLPVNFFCHQWAWRCMAIWSICRHHTTVL